MDEQMKEFKRFIDEAKDIQVDYLNTSQSENNMIRARTLFDTLSSAADFDRRELMEKIMKEYDEMKKKAEIDDSPLCLMIKDLIKVYSLSIKGIQSRSTLLTLYSIYLEKYKLALDEAKGYRISTEMLEYQSKLLETTRKHNEELNKVNFDRFMGTIDRIMTDNKDALNKIEYERKDDMKEFFVAMAKGQQAIEEQEKQKRIEDMRKEQAELQAKKDNEVIHAHGPPVEDEKQAPLPKTKVETEIEVEDEPIDKTFDDKEELKKYLNENFKFDKDKTIYLLKNTQLRNTEIADIIGSKPDTVAVIKSNLNKINVKD